MQPHSQGLSSSRNRECPSLASWDVKRRDPGNEVGKNAAQGILNIHLWAEGKGSYGELTANIHLRILHLPCKRSSLLLLALCDQDEENGVEGNLLFLGQISQQAPYHYPVNLGQSPCTCEDVCTRQWVLTIKKTRLV